jgi:hypothetical protein
MQNIFIYIDDSGVFDLKNNKYFVYAGYIFFSTEEKQQAERIYSAAEKTIRKSLDYDQSIELKSFGLSSKHKSSLFRSMNKFSRFSNIVEIKRVKKEIQSHKKHKQRFLDYTIKRTIKAAILEGANKNLFDISKKVAVRIYFDEHTTATSGLYEFKESIESELINGTFNWNFQTYYQPILIKGSCIDFKMMDSSKSTLIRASDIVANLTFYKCNFGYDNLEDGGCGQKVGH